MRKLVLVAVLVVGVAALLAAHSARADDGGACNPLDPSCVVTPPPGPVSPGGGGSGPQPDTDGTGTGT